MLSWSSNFLVVLKLKSRCSPSLESAWTMKLIRSSSLGAADFFVFLHLLFFLNTSTSNLIFLPSSPTPSNSSPTLFQLPQLQLRLLFLVWSIDALQQIARAYKCLSPLLFHFPVSSEVSFSRIIWSLILPSHLLSPLLSHLMFHFPVSSDVSLPVLCRMQRAKWEKKNVTCWFSSRKLVHSREKP